jgi:hypothetical protein
VGGWGAEDAEEGVAQGGGDEAEACEACGRVSWAGASPRAVTGDGGRGGLRGVIALAD